jgi:hypothetical protein
VNQWQAQETRDRELDQAWERYADAATDRTSDGWGARRAAPARVAAAQDAPVVALPMHRTTIDREAI